MAYGNILGYQPTAQPGAYSFQTADGGSRILTGPPAEDLKAKLDASAGLAGQKVAGPGGGAPGQLGGGKHFDQFGNEMTAPPQAPAFVDALKSGPAVSDQNMLAGGDKFDQFGNKTYSAPAAAAAPPPSAAPVTPIPLPEQPADTVPASIARSGETGESHSAAQPPPTAHPIFVNGINTGRIQMPDGRIAEAAPGVAAVTQQGLLDKAASGVAVPHSASESTTGGFTPDQEYLERRHDLAIDKRLLIDKTADAEAENAVREKQLADQQAAQAAQWKAEEQARTNQITAQVQKDLETKDRLQKEYANAKVDPRRIFSGQGGTARSVLAAIAAGLGTAGQGMQAMGGHPGAPNLGYQIVQTAIDRDINAQENEIKIKGEVANNALSQYVRSGLSLDQAKIALRSAQLGWSAAQTAQSAALTKGSMVDVNRDALHNQLLSGLNDADEQYRVQSLGTRTKQVASQVAYPHGGSSGGLRYLTPEQTDKVNAGNVELGGKQATTAKTLNDIEHPKGGGVAAKTQGALADNQAAQQVLIKAAADAGLKYDEKSGSFEGQAPAIFKEGAGSFNKDYTAHLGSAAPLVLKAEGVQRVGGSEQEQWTKQGKTMSGEQNTKFLQAQLETLKAKERAIRAGGGGVTETAAPAPEPEPTE